MGEHPSEPITYDPANVFLPLHGLNPEDLKALAPQLERAREQVFADLQLLRSGAEIPSVKQPLDAGFIDLPDRLLADYRRDPRGSELGKILQTAAELRANLDRLVVIGIGGSYMGTRSLFEAHCHPYHNLLSRAERNDYPRLYFAGYNVDNDTTQGLLDLLGRGQTIEKLEDRWGIVVVSKSGGTLEPAVAFRQLFNVLRESSPTWARKLVVAVTGEGSKLHQLSQQALDTQPFFIPTDVGGRFSIFTACGLLPAAVLGIDLVRLLEGASAMSARCRSTQVGSNPVLDYTGICHLMEVKRGVTIRVMSLWNQGMEAFGFWYDQLLSESLGKAELGATPITVVNTRDLHSRAQQHQQGRRDKLITNVILKSTRREKLPVGVSEYNQDGLNEISDRVLPEIMSAAIEGTNRAYREDNRPTADIQLGGADEYSLGQLYQMLMLATSVEGYLLGINPYGQPGVEAYKGHMNAALGEGRRS